MGGELAGGDGAARPGHADGDLLRRSDRGGAGDHRGDDPPLTARFATGAGCAPRLLAPAESPPSRRRHARHLAGRTQRRGGASTSRGGAAVVNVESKSRAAALLPIAPIWSANQLAAASSSRAATCSAAPMMNSAKGIFGGSKGPSPSETGVAAASLPSSNRSSSTCRVVSMFSLSSWRHSGRPPEQAPRNGEGDLFDMIDVRRPPQDEKNGQRQQIGRPFTPSGDSPASLLSIYH